MNKSTRNAKILSLLGVMQFVPFGLLAIWGFSRLLPPIIWLFSTAFLLFYIAHWRRKLSRLNIVQWLWTASSVFNGLGLLAALLAIFAYLLGGTEGDWLVSVFGGSVITSLFFVLWGLFAIPYVWLSLDSLAQLKEMGLLLQVAKQALTQWPIDTSSIDLVKYRENAVYKVTTTDGTLFALRIHRLGYHTEASIISELQWMAALADSGLEVPRVVPNTAGDLFIMATSKQLPEPRVVDVLEWLAGQTMRDLFDEAVQVNDTATISSLFLSMGESMAQLHNQSAAWEAPDGFYRHSWDLEGLVGDQPFWGRFWELELLTDEQKQLMQQVRARLYADLSEYGQSAETYGLIHADFNFDNVLIDGDNAKIIDFDDAGYGWHLFDIAGTLEYVIGDPIEQLANEAFFTGYRKYRPLSDTELQHLPMFLLVRSCTYLGWLRDRQEVEGFKERAAGLIDLACRLADDYLQE